MKNKVIICIAILTMIAALIFLYLAISPWPIIGIGAMGAVTFYALWDMPPKHKNFSYSDQQQATFRAFGGGGQPGIDAFLENTKPKKKNSKKIIF
jgi:hypothetical protein